MSEETNAAVAPVEKLDVLRKNDEGKEVSLEFKGVLSEKRDLPYYLNDTETEGWEDKLEAFIGRKTMFRDFVLRPWKAFLQNLFKVATVEATDSDKVLDVEKRNSLLSKYISQLSKRGETIRELQTRLLEICKEIGSLKTVKSADGSVNWFSPENLPVQAKFMALSVEMTDVAETIQRKKAANEKDDGDEGGATE